jgi:hypothetical protein
MTTHDHEPQHHRMRTEASASTHDGNAWDEVRITAVTRPAHAAPLITAVDWLDGELGAAISAPSGSAAPRAPRER